jgi:hypothetical protein
MVVQARPTPTTSFDAASTLYNYNNTHLPPTTPQPFTTAYTGTATATASRTSLPASDSNDWRSHNASQSQSQSQSTPTHSSSSASALLPRGGYGYGSSVPTTATTAYPFVVANPEGTLSNPALPPPLPRPRRPSKGTPESQAQSAGTSSPSTTRIVTTALPPSVPGSTELTDEQVVFVNNLRGLNVPAAEIARLMEVMRREREAGAGAGAGAGGLNAGDAPPRYDFKSPN